VLVEDQGTEILQYSLNHFRLLAVLHAGPSIDIPPVIAVIVVVVVATTADTVVVVVVGVVAVGARRATGVSGAFPRFSLDQNHEGRQQLLQALFVLCGIAIHQVQLTQVVENDHLAPDGRLVVRRTRRHTA